VRLAQWTDIRHAEARFLLIGWLAYYRTYTPHTSGSAQASIRLDALNEPQPDVCLRIKSAAGGQSFVDAQGILAAAPELIGEVVPNAAAYALHEKLDLFRRAGVREYIVWRVHDGAIDWFELHDGRYTLLPVGTNGVYCSKVFPGLWLHPNALTRGDGPAIQRIVEQGLANPEHHSFVGRLNAAADIGETR
jgi:putative restriction endonuclease